MKSIAVRLNVPRVGVRLGFFTLSIDQTMSYVRVEKL